MCNSLLPFKIMGFVTFLLIQVALVSCYLLTSITCCIAKLDSQPLENNDLPPDGALSSI